MHENIYILFFYFETPCSFVDAKTSTRLQVVTTEKAAV
jgi:hypothetical protein